MDIRIPSEKDKIQVKKLWEYCFDDSPEFVEWFFENRYKSQYALASYDKDNIRSALQLLPYKIMIRNRQVDTSYLVGMSTWPQYRGRGDAAALIRQSLKIMHERQEWVSILLPFRYDFYRKYGWEICYEHLTYRGNNELFTGPGRISGDIIPVSSDNIDILDKCYHEFMQDYNGYVIRREDDWKRILGDLYVDHGTGYIVFDGAKATGYVLFTIANRELRIRELIHNAPEAKDILLKVVASHYSQSDAIIWNAPADDITYVDMHDSRGLMYKQTYVMGRIVDVRRALNGLKTQKDFELYLKVIDDVLPWNDGVFYLKSVNGMVEVTPSDGFPQSTVSINTLAQLLWGYIGPSQAKKHGKLECSDDKVMDILNEIFSITVPYIIEDY
ncbi:MAG: GNAT family N-acetyltransferase [Clostridiales bacterium]|nr:GNAT family N-acetyltransferase [Clostridiales bacterium]